MCVGLVCDTDVVGRTGHVAEVHRPDTVVAALGVVDVVEVVTQGVPEGLLGGDD